MVSRVTSTLSRHGYVLAVAGDRPEHRAVHPGPRHVRQGPVGAALPARHPAGGERRRHRAGASRRRPRLPRLELLLPAAVPHARDPRPQGLAVPGRVPRGRRHRRHPGRAHARTRSPRARAGEGDRGPEQAERRGRLADVHRADGRELSQRGGRGPRRGVGDPVLPRGRRAALVLPGAGRQLHRRGRRRARSPRPWTQDPGAPASTPESPGRPPWRRPATAGCTCPCAARPACPACSPCRRAATAGRTRRGRPARDLAQQPRRRVPRAREAAGRRHHGGRRARGRPAQVQPALVGVPRAQDAAGRPHRHREQPARERRPLGRAERARRAARHRRRRGAPQQQHQRAARALATRVPRVGATTRGLRAERRRRRRHRHPPRASARPRAPGTARGVTCRLRRLRAVDEGAAEPPRERAALRGRRDGR